LVAIDDAMGHIPWQHRESTNLLPPYTKTTLSYWQAEEIIGQMTSS